MQVWPPRPLTGRYLWRCDRLRCAKFRVAAEVTETCRLIITATPSRTPLIGVNQVKPGTHITAMGSDTHLKQELDSKILQIADVVVADSIEQCLSRGEISKALQADLIKKEDRT